jgi:hypothetical protein
MLGGEHRVRLRYLKRQALDDVHCEECTVGGVLQLTSDSPDYHA